MMMPNDPKPRKNEDTDTGHKPDTEPDPHYVDDPHKPVPTGDPEKLDGIAPEDLDSDEERS